jgi:3-dehydroquinate synthase
MQNPILIHPLAPSIYTQVYAEKGLIKNNKLSKLIKGSKNKLAIIADSAVKELYATPLAQQIQAELIEIPSGEKTKSQEMAFYLLKKLSQLKAGRDTTLIAMGGGVTTDLVGFVASIYLRGISLIFIPTTLLAAVDAAIGGKTAINSPFGKNLIGTIYHPEAVFIDFDTFLTLPEKELFNGLAEILKIGLVYDASIWQLAQKNQKDLSLIFKAIQGKISIIAQDSTEQGMRRILNFGHTIGHGLEFISGYETSHGEAVALGSLAESYLSMQLGYLEKEEFEEIQKIYSAFPLQLPKNYERSKLVRAMAYDKKNALENIRFVLLEKIGRAKIFDGAYCKTVLPEQLISTLDWMEKIYL